MSRAKVLEKRLKVLGEGPIDNYALVASPADRMPRIPKIDPSAEGSQAAVETFHGAESRSGARLAGTTTNHFP
jgi:hypothetical protein